MKKVILVVILSIILLASLVTVYLLHAQIFVIPTPVEATEPPVAYRVSFLMGDTLLEEQTVEENALPAPVTVEIPGIQVIGWTDGQAVVDPARPVTGDVRYQLVYYPQLSGHSPFLFANEEGLLQPDKALTRGELLAALHALAADGAKDYFPQLIDDDMPLTHAELVETLGHFFPAEPVAEAFPQDVDPTRGIFAQGMYLLLARDSEELLNLTVESEIPTDITAQRTDAVALLESAVAHEQAEDGFLWSEMELPSAYEPGFVNLDGQLYYVQEDHYLLRDGYVGTLYFDADGRYTSGDATLDATVVTILQTLIAENPEADRFTLLRAVFEHCYENYTYRRTYDHPAYGSTGWEIQRANAMFESTKGNCYSYAAIFWALSRALGYETRAISGKVLSDEQPHSWCIIQLEDGEDYIFDPQWQYNYIERGLDHDMFKIPMERIGYWQYQWKE